MRLLLFVALGLFSVTGFCGELTGNPHIIDGDSIRIADVEIRLQGIDAPEGKQMCKIKGEEWACGKAAKETLSFFRLADQFVLQINRLVLLCASAGDRHLCNGGRHRGRVCD